MHVRQVLLPLLLLSDAIGFAPQGSKKAAHVPRFKTSLQSKEEQTERWLQSYGEKSRKYRRSYFTADDWVRSRRSDRLVDNIKTTLVSGLIRQLDFELPFMLFSAMFIDMWNTFLVAGYDDFYGVHHPPFATGFPLIVLPTIPLTLATTALGLMLTFRTNVSYARWNEARTAWGKVINDSRSIVRMGATWAQSYKNIDGAKIRRLGEAVCSFSRTLQNRVLPPQEDEDDYRNYCATMITDQEYADKLVNAKHRPTAALAEITSSIIDLELNPIHQVEVEHPVTGLCDALGASERLFTSPVPLFYTRHTARFLAFWLLGVPLALYEPFKGSWNHIGMIPATVMISAFLLGIEELATQLEEPFSILPMETMCDKSIRTPVMEQVERSQKRLSPNAW